MMTRRKYDWWEQRPDAPSMARLAWWSTDGRSGIGTYAMTRRGAQSTPEGLADDWNAAAARFLAEGRPNAIVTVYAIA